MNATSAPFYSQTVPADLNGSIWDATAEGAQNYPGDSEFSFAFGHITPRGHGQDPNEEDITGKWIAAEEAPAVVAEPMRRISSQSSASSLKHRTIKASAQKSRPRILSTISQTSQLSSFVDMSGNAQMDSYLLPDSDAHSVSSQMFYPTLPMSVDMTDGLSYTQDLLTSSMAQQHVDPTHMRLDFDSSLPGNSPSASWSSCLSPVGSRISSPGIPDESWSSVPIGTPSQGSESSNVMGLHSPSLSHHQGSGLVGPESLYGAELPESSLMSSTFTRRSSGEGESSARDHPLYKNAMPKADGLFHCPWEGHASCNHKPEKLKCNYDKFVDSHLKPYRCKVDSCENARFSSTACLLRHEREAHAMHGHGDKPYLCPYEGCDRAVPGCGFPRNWNLRDHMRRVHNDNGQSLTMPSGSHSSSRGSHAASTKGRKRKSKDSESSSSGRKSSSKSTSEEAAAAAARAVELPLIEEWWEHRNAVAEYLQRYNDPVAFEVLEQSGQASEHFSAMEKISRRLKKSREPHRRSHLHHSG
ncbi:hypothetical protein BX600DRAFT_433179 [Xylariales sp. PMI_506]|nr:hypothetical protein BX600DRAFT_433179 [Xylariales sp. PMI_506]